MSRSSIALRAARGSVVSMSIPRAAGSAGRGHAVARRAAEWLHLAAAPTFAAMALATAVFSGGAADMLCMGMQGSSPMNGMALMYLLMSAFHVSPWLKLIAKRRPA